MLTEKRHDAIKNRLQNLENSENIQDFKFEYQQIEIPHSIIVEIRVIYGKSSLNILSREKLIQ